MPQLTIGEAAELLGVSVDTVRRWTDGGKLPGVRNERGHRVIEGRDLAAFLHDRGRQDLGLAHSSARNRFVGLVTEK